MSTFLVLVLGCIGFFGGAALATWLVETLAGKQDGISQREQNWIQSHARNSRT